MDEKIDEKFKEFDKNEFRVEKYVNGLVQECVGGLELQQRKNKIQQFSDQTSSALKKHVYANYMQFIETAKEISHLESEMYQLSHILIEQRNLLSSLGDNQKKGNSSEEIDNSDGYDEEMSTHNTQALRTIKEMVPGFQGNLDGKVFLNDGALIELDSENYRPIQRVSFFLFNDLLIVCKVKHDKKLEFVTQYDPRKIAVINIKDLDGVKNAINIITSDGSKIFQCITVATKNEWIEKFEVAFRFNQNSKLGKKGQAPPPPGLQKQFPSLDTKSIMSDTTISPTDDNHSATLTENWPPEWLAAAPEEIQAFIAQRHFEEALILIHKSEEYIQQDATFWNAAEISGKIKMLNSNLANALLHELSNCHSRNLQAALRSSRRPLKLLAEMGKARQACGSLLKVCSAAIRTGQREARRNNSEISELFFCDLSQVANEFLRAFNGQGACVSALVVWSNTELRYFVGQLIKHYLAKGTQLETVALCVEGVRQPCLKLREIGLDLSYHLEGLLRNSLEQIIDDSRHRLVETIGRTEDSWQPYNLQSKSNLKNLLREMENLGLNMITQVTGDTWINLTQSTVNFCRHFLSVTESCAYLAKNEALNMNIEVLLRDLFLTQHAVNPIPGLAVDLNFVSKNKVYLVQELLPIAISKYEQISDHRNEMLIELKRQMGGSPPKPKPRSVYQTDVI